jgi:SPX domain protein involved in polyphosphate accumulation
MLLKTTASFAEKKAMPLTTDTKKVMFEIYREADFSGRYKVVYFTELGEHDKEIEIQEAMRGEHVFDGFLLHRERNQAKQVVDEILERLNRGEDIDQTTIERNLQPYLA